MWGNSGGRLEGRRRQRGARSKGAFDLAIFCDIFLRKHETQIMIFGYDADLRGLRDCATNAITGAAPVDNQSECFEARRNFLFESAVTP
jgi:hypothetical protein